MKVKVWGARGSIPAPGPETMRYGGNTSCVAGDALRRHARSCSTPGTGIRTLGLALPPPDGPVNILLTHLHLDHIQGLMFFAPCFRPEAEIVDLGARRPRGRRCRDRIARYISAPLSPVEVRELPCHVSFREAEAAEWQIGPATVRAGSVTPPRPDARLPHRGRGRGALLHPRPRAGARHAAGRARGRVDLRAGARRRRRSAHPRRAVHRRRVPRPSRLGALLAVGRAARSARRAAARRLLLFHHDPLHGDDFLDALGIEARARWEAAGGAAGAIGLASERLELTVASAGSAPRVP